MLPKNTKKDSVIITKEEQEELHNDISSSYTTEQQLKMDRKLKWKIDLRIMPFFIAVYLFQFLDKTLINYAAVMGIKKNLEGNDFSNLGTIFYVGFLAAEPLSGYLIQKLSVSKFLGANVCIWGMIVSFHACTTGYAGLMVIRVLLGIFEASVAGCLVIVGGMWWTKPEQSRRICLWYMQVGVAQIIGSVMSFGFQHVHSTIVKSWQIMFIFMGILTFLLGIGIIVFLPDNPLKCNFLTNVEKDIVIEHIRENQAGMENKVYKFYQVKELLYKDKQTWLLFLIILLSSVDNGAVTNFSTTLIQSFGFSNEISALIQIPSGIVSIISTILCCYVTSYIGNRSFMIAFVTLPTILGACLYMGLKADYKVGKLFGIYFLSFNAAVIAAVYNWNSSNTSGYTKRVTRNVLTLIGFCIGNLIGPQLFQSNDAPDYLSAKIALVVMLGLVFILAIILRYVVYFENNRREKVCESLTPEERNRDVTFLDLTDIENINFRYVN